MMSLSVATEIAQGMLESGALPTRAAMEVEVVRMTGVKIVRGSLTRDMRNALNAGVKAGKLGRLPKDGLRPEAYFHPNSKWRAMEERDRLARASETAIHTVTGRHFEDDFPGPIEEPK